MKATSATGKTIRVNRKNVKPGAQVNTFVYGENMLHSAAGQDATSISVESTVAAERNTGLLGRQEELANLADGTVVVLWVLVWAQGK